MRRGFDIATTLIRIQHCAFSQSSFIDAFMISNYSAETRIPTLFRSQKSAQDERGRQIFSGTGRQRRMED